MLRWSTTPDEVLHGLRIYYWRTLYCVRWTLRRERLNAFLISGGSMAHRATPHITIVSRSGELFSKGKRGFAIVQKMKLCRKSLPGGREQNDFACRLARFHEVVSL